MGAALAQDDPPDRRPTGKTRLPVAMVHPVEGHEPAGLPAGIAVVGYGAAAMADARLEDQADRPSERTDLFLVERRGPPGRPDSRPEEGFIRIDVPDARNIRLVQEQRLDPG